MKASEAKNVLGTRLLTCSTAPLTGFFRDGCCHTDSSDRGTHTVCAVMTPGFLEFSRQQGNDLITPRPEFNFPGLKSGDRWCLCATRWLEAEQAGFAPRVVMAATHEKTLEIIDIETLTRRAVAEA